MNKACCGIGGDYNFNMSRLCGTSGVPVCADPDKYVSWDGLHMTQKTHQYLSKWLIDRMVPKLKYA